MLHLFWERNVFSRSAQVVYLLRFKKISRLLSFNNFEVAGVFNFLEFNKFTVLIWSFRIGLKPAKYLPRFFPIVKCNCAFAINNR